MARTFHQILLGQRVRTIKCGPMRLIEAWYAPHTRFGAHAHEHGNISLILAGELEETVCGASQRCSTCSVVVKPAGTIHSNRFGPQGARTIVLEIPDDDSQSRLARWRWFHDGDVCAAALRVYEAARGEDGDGYEFLRNRIFELLAAIHDACAEQRRLGAPPWVERVRDRLHEQFEQRLCVAELADEMHVHPVYLARVFRARFGCAVTDYVRRLRVRHAAHRLSTSSIPLSHVAAECGFADQAHLSRLFKRSTGLTPGRFRQLVRGN